MKRFPSAARVSWTRTVAVILLVLGLGWTRDRAPSAQELETGIDNNQPFRNSAGHAATFSTHSPFAGSLEASRAA